MNIRYDKDNNFEAEYLGHEFDYALFCKLSNIKAPYKDCFDKTEYRNVAIQAVSDYKMPHEMARIIACKNNEGNTYKFKIYVGCDIEYAFRKWEFTDYFEAYTEFMELNKKCENERGVKLRRILIYSLANSQQ
jgi:hypothetical protein